ncbi:hypothetical protein CC79DRAFT_1324789 [Sarocladium strictum]
MKYSVAATLFAAVSGAAAYGKNGTVIVTEVVESYTTYCPAPTEIVHGDKTITVTSAGIVTITDCPCTIEKPVETKTYEVCHDCPEETHPAPPPVVETPTVAPPAPTGGVTPTHNEPEPVPTAGAGKLSAAGLAGVVGLAAFIL